MDDLVFAALARLVGQVGVTEDAARQFDDVGLAARYDLLKKRGIRKGADSRDL